MHVSSLMLSVRVGPYMRVIGGSCYIGSHEHPAIPHPKVARVRALSNDTRTARRTGVFAHEPGLNSERIPKLVWAATELGVNVMLRYV